MNEGRLRVKARRFLTLFLCVLLAFGPICRLAFADDYEGGGGGSHGFGGSYPIFGTVWYGPSSTSNTVGTTYYQYGVVANTKYDAAYYNLDINESLYGELTNKKKAALLDGPNAFTIFADLFHVGKPDLDPSLIFNTDYAVLSAWNSACQLYGETYCFSAMYTTAQKQAAFNYLREVMMQDDAGGGATDMDVYDDQYLIPVTEFAPNPSSTMFQDLKYIGMRSDIYNWYSETCRDNDLKILVTAAKGTNGTGSITTRYYMLDKDKVEFRTDEIDSSRTYFIYIKDTFMGHSSSINSDRNYSGTFNDEKCVLPKPKWVSNAYIPADTEYTKGTYINAYPIYWYGWANPDGTVGGDDGGGDGGGGDDPVEPPVTWPDPPKSPTVDPPVVPTPPEPDPPEPPDPTPPDPPTPWVPIPGPNDDPITGDDFQDLLDALAEHCQHIRDAMSDNFEQLWTNQSDLLVTEFQSTRDTLVDNMQWLGTDVIAKGFTDLSSYLNELFEWLADQLEFNLNVENNPYDDSSVVYWLKRIWTKLGSGDITTRPTDPNVDNDGWWEWLTGLLGGLVGALADIGLDKLGGLVDALDTLKDKFPFCIPWDVAALLALLVSEPVAPVVSVPMYALTATDGVQQVGIMTIDLDTYSTAWEAVRWIERIGFCVYLAMRSKDFLDLLGKIKG